MGMLRWRWHVKKRELWICFIFVRFTPPQLFFLMRPLFPLPLSFRYLSPSLHLHFHFSQSRPTTPPAGFSFCATVFHHPSLSPPTLFLHSGHEIAGMVTVRAVYEIAQVKSQDDSFKLRDISMQNIVKSIIGSARSLGIKVVNEWESFKLHSTAFFTTYNTMFGSRTLAKSSKLQNNRYKGTRIM